MPADQLTFELSGSVSLAKFAEAMKRFQGLVSDLSKEVGHRAPVDWRIEELSQGSALTTVRGRGPNPEAIELVVVGFGVVGKALEQGTPIPYSERIRRRAASLAELIDGGVTALRFETTYVDAFVGPQNDKPIASPSIKFAYGQIKGRVETLSSRRGLRFTLYDPIFDRPISCYLQEGQEEDMRDAWGRRVVVAGSIGREPDTKRPVVVRNIDSVEILVDIEPGSYRQARGALGAHEDGPLSEMIIRSMRDGE